MDDNFLSLAPRVLKCEFWEPPRGSAWDSWRLPGTPTIPGSVCSAFCHYAHAHYLCFCPRLSASFCCSVCLRVSLPLAPLPENSTVPKKKPESQCCRLHRRIFISHGSWLAGRSCLSNIFLADQSALWFWQYLGDMTLSILCLWLLATGGPVNLTVFNLEAYTVNELKKTKTKNPENKNNVYTNRQF